MGLKSVSWTVRSEIKRGAYNIPLISAWMSRGILFSWTRLRTSYVGKYVVSVVFVVIGQVLHASSQWDAPNVHSKNFPPKTLPPLESKNAEEEEFKFPGQNSPAARAEKRIKRALGPTLMYTRRISLIASRCLLETLSLLPRVQLETMPPVGVNLSGLLPRRKLDSRHWSQGRGRQLESRQRV